MAMGRYWLVKSDPDSFSIHDLATAPDQTTCWDGVRNYQARNYMRDGMKHGDLVLYYHSGAPSPAVAGVARVAREAYPDHTAWSPGGPHFDPKSTPQNPIWWMVDLKLVEAFPRPVTLECLRDIPELKNMELLRKGSRLSVQPVTEQEFEIVVSLGRTE